MGCQFVEINSACNTNAKVTVEITYMEFVGTNLVMATTCTEFAMGVANLRCQAVT